MRADGMLASHRCLVLVLQTFLEGMILVRELFASIATLTHLHVIVGEAK